MTSEPEDMSFKSVSQFAEVNEAVVKLPLTAKTYADSIKYYRFKIERFYQDIRMILNDIIENTKINEEMQGEHRRDLSKNMHSDESQSFHGHTEREAFKGSFIYTFSDIGKSIDFRNRQAVEKCLRDIEENSSINSILPELCFDSHANSLFFGHYGHVLAQDSFSDAVKKSSMSRHFPSDCYSYTLLKHVNLGAIRSVLIFSVLSQLLEGTLGGLPQPDALFKSSGVVASGSVSHFLNKQFCTCFLAFSQTPRSQLLFETGSLDVCLHLVMIGTPIEELHLTELEGNTKENLASSIVEGGSKEIRVSKPAAWSSRQSKYATGSISKLLLIMDADGDNKLGLDDIFSFAKKHEIFINQEVPSSNRDSARHDCRGEQEEVRFPQRQRTGNL